jgi:hypothetical protein
MEALLNGFGALAVAGRGFNEGINLFTVACEPAVDLPLFPGLKPALDYWSSKCGAHPMPSRSDIDPGEMVDFLPRVTLADVERTPFLRFRYRLCGTGVCHVHPGDPTHIYTDQLQPHTYGQLVHSQYLEALQARAPSLHLNIFDDRQRYRAYAHLVLPLSRDHDHVDMIMTVDSLNQDQAKMMNLLVQLQRRAGIELGDFYFLPTRQPK